MTKKYYIWADDSCDNDTTDLSEAIAWASDLMADYGTARIVDEDGNEFAGADLVKECLAFSRAHALPGHSVRNLAAHFGCHLSSLPPRDGKRPGEDDDFPEQRTVGVAIPAHPG